MKLLLGPHRCRKNTYPYRYSVMP